MPTISPLPTVVVVKSVTVVLRSTVPVLIATPEVLMLLLAVGMAVHAASCQSLTLQIAVCTIVVDNLLVTP